MRPTDSGTTTTTTTTANTGPLSFTAKSVKFWRRCSYSHLRWRRLWGALCRFAGLTHVLLTRSHVRKSCIQGQPLRRSIRRVCNPLLYISIYKYYMILANTFVLLRRIQLFAVNAEPPAIAGHSCCCCYYILNELMPCWLMSLFRWQRSEINFSYWFDHRLRVKSHNSSGHLMTVWSWGLFQPNRGVNSDMYTKSLKLYSRRWL